MSASVEKTTPERAAGCQAIDPGHRIGPSVARRSDLEESVEVLQAHRLGLEFARSHGLQLEFDPGDDAGQAQAADRRGEEMRALRRSDLEEGAVASQQPERADVTPEGAGLMVVLAMDVVGNCPTRGSRTWSPASRARTSRAAHRSRASPPIVSPASARTTARRPVGRDDAIKPAHAQQAAAVVEAHVAIGSAEAVRQETRGARACGGRVRCQAGQQFVVEGRFPDPALPLDDTAPGGGRDGRNAQNRITWAAIARTAQATPTMMLVRSRAAKRIGSSFIRPRVVSIHMRSTQ